MGCQPVKHVISTSAHPKVPWASELAESLLALPGWQDGALAQRFVDILSVRLCESTVDPSTSQLKKYLGFL